MWSHPWPHTRPAGYPQVWAALQWDYLSKASLSFLTGKPVAEGHSFGLQGIDLEETGMYIAPVLILWQHVQNAVRALKAELPYWFGGRWHFS